MSVQPDNRDAVVEIIASVFEPSTLTKRTATAKRVLEVLDAAGIALVPVEPTEEMRRASLSQQWPVHNDIDDSWARMVAASPYRSPLTKGQE